MIAAAKWAREQKIPYCGICLGLQTAAIEFARSVVGIKGIQAEICLTDLRRSFNGTR